MVSLKEHIAVIRKIPPPFKNKQLFKMAYHIFTEHIDEIKDIDQFLDLIMKRPEPLVQKPRK